MTAGTGCDRRYSLPVLVTAFGLAAVVPVACGQGFNLAIQPSDALRKVSVNVLVTLDVFSGRPNPSWSLSPDEAQELTRRLQGLPPAHGPAPEGDLGYRGFHLAMQAPTLALPSEVTVGKGTVTVRGQGGTRHYIDAKGIELWLIDQARQQGHGALVPGP